MQPDLDLCYATAGELLALLKTRRLSPLELMRNSLARLEQVNGKLNCFCFVYPEEALALAEAAERRLARGDDAPLLGLPVAFKDLTPTKGKRTTLGSKAFEHWVPTEDAPIVEAFTRAGAIILGKTTTPEFAYGSFTESPLWGITRNPWDLSRTPGGSSGGAGAAVASGCVALAEGSDMGGSVRIPAALCGVVGLKPSWGRIAFTQAPSLLESLNHYGPLARSVEDARLFLAVAQGPDERDVSSLPQSLDLSQPLARSVQGLRLAVSEDLNIYALDPDVRAAFWASVELLRAAGAEIEEVRLPWSRRILDAWWEHWQVYMATFFGQAYDHYADQLDPKMKAMIEGGRAMTAVAFKRLEIERAELWRSLVPIFARCHALLCPTTAQPAVAVGGDDAALMIEDAEGRIPGLAMTEIFNFVSQCPALSVPCGLSRQGLPIGFQIVARRCQDDLALIVGGALESALGPWRRPPEIYS